MKLIASMVAKDPNDRPAASEVARVMREVGEGLGSYDCTSCMDSFELNAGVLCSGAEPHILCHLSDEDCFNKHVKTQLEGTEVNTFKCAFCPSAYPEKVLMSSMNEDNAKKLRENRERVVQRKQDKRRRKGLRRRRDVRKLRVRWREKQVGIEKRLKRRS